MRPLHEPSTFCIRSFEAAPDLMPMLRKQEAELRARSLDVRFVEAALSNSTSAAATAATGPAASSIIIRN